MNEGIVISQAQIAEKLNISRSTVSAVLSGNKKMRISQETIQRVLAAAEELRYRPNHHAVVMRKGKTGMIGIMHGGGRLQSAHERQIFANSAVVQNGYKVLSLAPTWFEGSLEEVENFFVESRVEGVLLSGIYNLKGDGSFPALKAAGIPYVVLSGRKIPGVPLVRCNVRQSFYELTRLLLSNGHKRLSLILRNREGWQLPGVNWAMEERIEGFSRAVHDFSGTVFKTSLSEDGEHRGEASPSGITGEIIYCEPEKKNEIDAYRVGKDAMEALLERGRMPTAVMCSNDSWAVGALSACADRGIRVPEDLAITGFDNSSESPYCYPPLTTVAQPNDLIAKQAVDLLIQSIKNRGENEQVYEWLGRVLVRKSCGTSHSLRITPSFLKR